MNLQQSVRCRRRCTHPRCVDGQCESASKVPKVTTSALDMDGDSTTVGSHSIPRSNSLERHFFHRIFQRMAIALHSVPTFHAAGPCVLAVRSEERRVGTECVSTCRSRWSPAHRKKKKRRHKPKQK